jgi:hypothetical protein
VGPLTRAALQLFTAERTPYGELFSVDVPNEIVLEQLVTFYILRVYDRPDANTVFQWSLEEMEAKDKKDKTKRIVIDIPQRIPIGFTLRVRASSLHQHMGGRRIVQCSFGSARVNFTVKENDEVGRLTAIAEDGMRQRGQGTQWIIEGNPREAIDFEYCYPIVPIPEEEEVSIYWKQRKMKIKVCESWMNLSDRLVRQFGLPVGALFQIYQVDMNIQRLGVEDRAYSCDWVEGKQYWFDIVHDHAKDKQNFCREIRMVNYSGKADSLVVPGVSTTQDIAAIWKRIIDFPANVTLECASDNSIEYYWGLRECGAQSIACTVRSQNNHGDAMIFDGSDIFKAA